MSKGGRISPRSGCGTNCGHQVFTGLLRNYVSCHRRCPASRQSGKPARGKQHGPRAALCETVNTNKHTVPSDSNIRKFQQGPQVKESRGPSYKACRNCGSCHGTLWLQKKSACRVLTVGARAGAKRLTYEHCRRLVVPFDHEMVPFFQSSGGFHPC